MASNHPISGMLRDNNDPSGGLCIARVMAFAAFCAFLAYAAFGLIVRDHFTLAAFGSGLMDVLFGSAGIIAGKQLTRYSLSAATGGAGTTPGA